MQHLFIITGASRGLGRAMAEQLSQHGGHTVLGISRQAPDAPFEQWTCDLAEPQPVAERLRHWLASFDASQFTSATLIGRRGMAAAASYCAVKAGLDNLARAQALEEALQANGARVCALAPGVMDTDMQVQLRSADPQAFPDHDAFVQMKSGGNLDSAAVAAGKVLAFLQRPDFGANPVADVRDF